MIRTGQPILKLCGEPGLTFRQFNFIYLIPIMALHTNHSHAVSRLSADQEIVRFVSALLPMPIQLPYPFRIGGLGHRPMRMLGHIQLGHTHFSVLRRGICPPPRAFLGACLWIYFCSAGSRSDSPLDLFLKHGTIFYEPIFELVCVLHLD